MSKPRVAIAITTIIFRNSDEPDDLATITCQSTVAYDREIAGWKEVRIAVGRNQIMAVCEETGRSPDDVIYVCVNKLGKKVLSGYLNYVAGTN